jgi:hypothetical protein
MVGYSNPLLYVNTIVNKRAGQGMTLIDACVGGVNRADPNVCDPAIGIRDEDTPQNWRPVQVILR